nr:hydrogenase small subunit [Desulfitobacterium hafniense]
MKRDDQPMESGYQRLARRGVSRRDFLKLCTFTCAALGIDLSLAPQIAEAAEANLSKKPVIWMQGQGCTGCSESLLSSVDPGPEEIILDLLSVRYHPTLMAASGEQAIQSLEDCISQGHYILVLEGSIPTADPRYCFVEGKPFMEQFKLAAEKAEAVIAVGSCACYGGIPRAGFTGAVGAQEVLGGVKVVNLPSCPVKPDRLVGLLLYYLSHNALPKLDGLNRPEAYYRYTLHDSCYRRWHYEKGEYLEDWNNPDTLDWCLYHKGCKGQDTYTNCANAWWNGGANFCGYAGSPCAGCSQPEYYEGFAPLFVNPKEVK